MVTSTQCNEGVAALLPQIPRYFTWQLSLPVSHNVRASSPGQCVQLLLTLTNAGTSSPPDCRYRLIYAHTSSRILPTCDISLGTQTLPAPEPGDFVGLILLYTSVRSVELVVVSLCPECCSNISRCQWHLKQHRLQFISWIVKLCATELVFQESLQFTAKRERLAHVCFVYWLIYIWIVKSNVSEFL